MSPFRENPKLHVNLGIGLALTLIVAAVGWEVGQGERGRPISLLLFAASYPFAAYGCAGYAASKGYGVWWGILPAILGLNLLALQYLTSLPDRTGADRQGMRASGFGDGYFLTLTAVMVFVTLACAVLAWGGKIEPQYRLPGKIGFFLCLAYFFWLFVLSRMASSSGDRGPDSGL